MEIKAGNVYKGKVTGIKPFGAFVQLENGKSGLVHISELSNKFINSVEEVVELHQEVEVRVKAIADDGKLNLTMKTEESKVKRQPRREREQQQPSMDLDKMIASFSKDSDEKHAMLGRSGKGRGRR